VADISFELENPSLYSCRGELRDNVIAGFDLLNISCKLLAEGTEIL
jgi:hypothetical protein